MQVLLATRIRSIAKDKAAELLAQLALNRREVVESRYRIDQTPPIKDTILDRGNVLTISNGFGRPRLGFREQMPLLRLDVREAIQHGLQGLNGITVHRAGTDFSVVTDGTFYLKSVSPLHNQKRARVEVLITNPRFYAGSYHHESPLLIQSIQGAEASEAAMVITDVCKAQVRRVQSGTAR